MVQYDLYQISRQAMEFGALQIREELVWLLKECLTLDNRGTAVELGVCNGGTYYALQQIFDQVIGIDTERKDFRFPLREQDQYLIGRTDKVEIEEPEEFDFLFIDADHSYDGVKADFELWYPRVKSGGIVAFHDIRGAQIDYAPHDDVRKFWTEEIKPYYTTAECIWKPDQVWFGIGIIYK